MLLAKQCKLEQLKEEIQHAVTKANSFGKSYSSNQRYEFVGVALHLLLLLFLIWLRVQQFLHENGYLEKKYSSYTKYIGYVT